MTWRLRNSLFLTVAFALGTSLGLAQTGSVTRIEEDDPSITYSGNWYSNQGPGNSKGAAALTNSTGARAVVTFTGRAITWIGVGDLWNGLATVTVDGQPYKVDGWAPTTQYQQVLFTVSGLSVGAHKLSIEINHERGPNGQGSWVWIDAFDVQDGVGVAGLPAATVGRVENDNPAVTYTGIWYSNVNGVHSGGTAVLAVGNGAAATLNFNGTGIAWLTYRDEWSGLARVILDNELKATIDAYLLPGQARTAAYTVEDLAPGPHTLRIEATGAHNLRSGGSWVWLDAFDVLQSSTTIPQTLTLSATGSYCVGAPWSVAVSNAVPGASIRLVGTSNGQSWAVAGWATAGVTGAYSENGVFASTAQGSHTMWVEAGGKVSNVLSFAVSKCGP